MPGARVANVRDRPSQDMIPTSAHGTNTSRRMISEPGQYVLVEGVMPIGKRISAFAADSEFAA